MATEDTKKFIKVVRYKTEDGKTSARIPIVVEALTNNEIKALFQSLNSSTQQEEEETNE